MWEEGREEVKTWMPRCHCLQLCLDWDFNLRRDLGSRTLLITCQRGMGFLVKLDVSICNMGLIIHELRRLHDLIYVSTQNSIWHCFCCYVFIIIIISHSTRNSGLQCLILETVQLNCQLFNFFFKGWGSLRLHAQSWDHTPTFCGCAHLSSWPQHFTPAKWEAHMHFLDCIGFYKTLKSVIYVPLATCL